MAVESVSSTGALSYVGRSGGASSGGTSVDTETFLKLLIAQLKYQDPLQPQSDMSFVTQLAQMTSLEQMMQMNSSLKGSQAFDMVGKHIRAEVLNEKTGVKDVYEGVVDRVVFKDGIPYVVVGNTAILVTDVVEVTEPPAQEAAGG